MAGTAHSKPRQKAALRREGAASHDITTLGACDDEAGDTARPVRLRSSVGRTCTTPRSDLSLLGDFQRVVHLDTEIAHGRLQLGMTKQQLHRTQVLRASIDQRCLGSSHRVRAGVGGIEPKFLAQPRSLLSSPRLKRASSLLRVFRKPSRLSCLKQQRRRPARGARAMT
jgi:hypothetical protein